MDPHAFVHLSHGLLELQRYEKVHSRFSQITSAPLRYAAVRAKRRKKAKPKWQSTSTNKSECSRRNTQKQRCLFNFCLQYGLSHHSRTHRRRSGGVEINTSEPPSWAKYPVDGRGRRRGRVATCSDPFSHRPHSGLTLSNIDWQIASNNICWKEGKGREPRQRSYSSPPSALLPADPQYHSSIQVVVASRRHQRSAKRLVKQRIGNARQKNLAT